MHFLHKSVKEYRTLSSETNSTSSIISKVWSFCNTLRDDGVGYGDYLEQLTYLLFLKMADEFSRPPYNRRLGIPEGYDWESLTAQRGRRSGRPLHRPCCGSWGQKKGIARADLHQDRQNKIQDPAKLFRLIDMIDDESGGSSWGRTSRASIYEGLLEKNAEDTKSGAGQYFTPRP